MHCEPSLFPYATVAPLLRMMRSSVVLSLPLLLAAGLALVLAGCGTSQPATDVRTELPSAFPNHSADVIQGFLPGPNDSLATVRLRSGMTVRSPEQSGSFSAELRYRRADSLYMTISPGFGIEAARLLVTPDSFYLYNRIERSLTLGSVADAERVLPLPVDSSEVLPNLLGMLQPNPDITWERSTSGELYRLTSPDGRERYFIDPTLWRVVRYEQRDAEGALVEDRTFSDFDRIGGLVVPQRVVFRRPQDNASATLTIRDLTVNRSDLSFALNVRNDVRRVPIGSVSPDVLVPPTE